MIRKHNIRMRGEISLEHLDKTVSQKQERHYAHNDSGSPIQDVAIELLKYSPFIAATAAAYYATI